MFELREIGPDEFVRMRDQQTETRYSVVIDGKLVARFADSAAAEKWCRQHAPMEAKDQYRVVQTAEDEEIDSRELGKAVVLAFAKAVPPTKPEAEV